MEDSHGYCFAGEQLKFIEYFDRCHSIGMTKSEIAKNIPFLQNYYCEVTDKLTTSEMWGTSYTNLGIVFEHWCKNVNLK